MGSSQSMKVVASTKLTRAERAMREAKKYGAANKGEYDFILPGEGGVLSQALPCDVRWRDRGLELEKFD